jgi:hypothetical protein
MVARVPPLPMPQVPATVHIRVDADRLHFFDPETGTRM